MSSSQKRYPDFFVDNIDKRINSNVNGDKDSE